MTDNLKGIKKYIFGYRSLISLYLGFASLGIYTIRLRPGNHYIIGIENILFLLAILLFPWNKEEIARILKFSIAIIIYAALALLLYYPSFGNLFISIVSTLMLIKCVIFGYFFYKFSLENLYNPIKTLYLICIFAQILILIMNGFQVDHNSGFNGVMGDRNYMSIMNVIFLYSILSLKKFLQKNSMVEELISYFFVTITIITVGLSYSRTGILGLIAVLALFYYKDKLLWIIIFTAFYFGIFDMVIGRFNYLTGSNETARLNQYLVFFEILKNNPINSIFGFGPMASEHLNWLSIYYKRIGVTEGLTVIHNTFFEVVLSFGIFGLVILIKIIKKIPWRSSMLMLILGAFNNLLIFLPFYILIAVSLRLFDNSKADGNTGV